MKSTPCDFITGGREQQGDLAHSMDWDEGHIMTGMDLIVTFDPNTMAHPMREHPLIPSIRDDAPRRNVNTRGSVVWFEHLGGSRLGLEHDRPDLQLLGVKRGV